MSSPLRRTQDETDRPTKTQQHPKHTWQLGVTMTAPASQIALFLPPRGTDKS